MTSPSPTPQDEVLTDEEAKRFAHILVHGSDGCMFDQSIVFKVNQILATSMRHRSSPSSAEVGATVEWSYSSGRRYPLHQPELVRKAIKMANWQEHRYSQIFLTAPVKFDDESIHDGQILWLCRAFQALTRDEIIKLYDSLIASAKDCLATGGDFTPQDVRDHMPHIYLPEPPK